MNPLTDARQALAALNAAYPPNLLKRRPNIRAELYEPASPPHILVQRYALLREIERLERAAGVQRKTSMRAHTG